MKKVLSIILICLLLITLYPKKVVLEKKYYSAGNITEITKEEYETLLNKKETFLLFVYQPLCTTSNDFENVLNEFVKDNKISIYKLKFSEMKKIDNTIKYYPSLAIIENGKIKKYLDANKKSDLKYFKFQENLATWLKKYIKNIT